jgi:hypothetical protein
MIKLSSSKMDSYAWCPRKYRLWYVEHIPTPYVSKALIIGCDTHNFIEKFWKNYNLNLDTYIYDLNNYLKQEVRKITHKDKYVSTTLQYYYSNFINFQIHRIQKYIETYGMDEEKIRKLFYPILNEKRGKVRINNIIEFSYLIDSFFENDDGNLLIDWKTDYKCNEKQFRTHLPQLNRYYVCLKELGYVCEAVGIFFVKDSLFFSTYINKSYSLEKECIDFVRMIQKSKFPKVKKNEKWKCCSNVYECEYFPEICTGTI